MSATKSLPARVVSTAQTRAKAASAWCPKRPVLGVQGDDQYDEPPHYRGDVDADRHLSLCREHLADALFFGTPARLWLAQDFEVDGWSAVANGWGFALRQPLRGQTAQLGAGTNTALGRIGSQHESLGRRNTPRFWEVGPGEWFGSRGRLVISVHSALDASDFRPRGAMPKSGRKAIDAEPRCAVRV